MSASRTVIRTSLSRAIPPSTHITSSRRTFFSLPTSSTQHLSATRVLPYTRPPLYELIADVDSYSRFVPYCSVSKVTRWSDPDPQNKRYPTLADLHVGWGGLSEVFTSQLLCVPGVSVQATSGGEAGGGSSSSASSVFQSLVTKWTLSDLDSAHGTRVHIDIKYQFVNPLYAAVSAAVSDKMASMMVEAFEKRAHEKLGRQPI